MIQNILFAMSLSGNMVFLLYILTYPLSKKYFTLEWKYRILKIAIVFYLVPIPVCKYLIMNIIHSSLPQLWDKINNTLVTIDEKYIIIVSQDFIKFSSKVRYTLTVVLVIGIVAFAIIQKHIIQYWKWKNVCFVASEKPTHLEQELFYKIKKEIGIKKRVELVCSEYCKSPMISGILSSVLIYPKWEKRIDVDKYEYMLRHELVHIKHHDLLIKYIGLLVMAVHWYNPLVYIMFHEISVISEMYCDSVVIGGKGEGERKQYGELILKLAVQNEFTTKGKFLVGMANSRSKWVYKRRILEMKRDTKYKVVLPVITTLFVCIAGGITAFAYEPPMRIYNDTGYDLGTDINVVIETEETMQAEFVSDYFFVDDNGNIFDLSKLDKNNRIPCSHDFSVHGTLNDHKKDEKGGCTVNSYEARICSICSDVKVGELKNTITYKCCPH